MKYEMLDFFNKYAYYHIFPVAKIKSVISIIANSFRSNGNYFGY